MCIRVVETGSSAVKSSLVYMVGEINNNYDNGWGEAEAEYWSIFKSCDSVRNNKNTILASRKTLAFHFIALSQMLTSIPIGFVLSNKLGIASGLVYRVRPV